MVHLLDADVENGGGKDSDAGSISPSFLLACHMPVTMRPALLGCQLPVSVVISAETATTRQAFLELSATTFNAPRKWLFKVC